MEERCWKDVNDIPLVYIFGICSHEGRSDARAGYGIDWGPNNSMSKGGPAIGEKTTLRAELTAILHVLKTATEYGISVPLCIRHQSERLENELRAWNDAARIASSQNADLLGAIGELASQMVIRIEKVDSSSSSVLKNAIIFAKRVAGMHPSSVAPLTDAHYEDGYRIIDISGICNDGQVDAIAGYGVFWGYEDARNQSGTVKGRQTSLRAYLAAFQQALTTALSTNHDAIIIRSRCPVVHRCITYKQGVGGKNRDFFDPINKLLRRFKKVIHLLPPKEIDIEGQKEAEILARQNSSKSRRHVSICGIETSNTGIARFGIFWGHGDTRNGSGWIGGQHSQLCAEITALRIAMKMGISEDDKYLTVYTDSNDFEDFLMKWRKQWEHSNWPLSTGKSKECLENYQMLKEMLDKLTVKVRKGHEGFIDEAQLLAKSVQTCVTVRTFGELQTGNNEPTARYEVLWVSADVENESGFVHDPPSSARAKIFAIRRALQIALDHGIEKLIILTDLMKDEYIDEEMREIQILEEKMEYVKFENTIQMS